MKHVGERDRMIGNLLKIEDIVSELRRGGIRIP